MIELVALVLFIIFVVGAFTIASWLHIIMAYIIGCIFPSGETQALAKKLEEAPPDPPCEITGEKCQLNEERQYCIYCNRLFVPENQIS